MFGIFFRGPTPSPPNLKNVPCAPPGMMRHLHFTQSLEPLQGGGLGASTLALHRQFLAMGIESTLCATHGGAPRRPTDRTLEFRRLKPEFLFCSSELCRQASELVAGSDVVHGHGLYVGTNLILGRQARRQHRLLVYHPHGMLEPFILNRSRWKKRLAHWLFEDTNFSYAGLWRALTVQEAAQIRACGVRAPIVVVPNGLDPEDYPPPADPTAPVETPLVPRLTKDCRRALFLGRIHPKKGLDLLLPAWAKLGAGTRDWQLVVAGPDENGYLNDVRQIARDLQIQDRVVFTGLLTGRTKTALLHSADLFVLSSYSEGFPMSLLEALVCRVPVLATRQCNFPEATSAGAGWECEAAPESLTAALGVALDASESERAERGRRGRHLIETRYGWVSLSSALVEACRATA